MRNEHTNFEDSSVNAFHIKAMLSTLCAIGLCEEICLLAMFLKLKIHSLARKSSASAIWQPLLLLLNLK